MRFGDFLKATVLLSAASATLLAALTVVGLQNSFSDTAVYVCFGWWILATVIGSVMGSRSEATHAIANLLSSAKHQHTLPDLAPARHDRQPAVAAADRHARRRRPVGLRAADRRYRRRFRDHLGTRLAPPGGGGRRDRGA